MAILLLPVVTDLHEFLGLLLQLRLFLNKEQRRLLFKSFAFAYREAPGNPGKKLNATYFYSAETGFMQVMYMYCHLQNICNGTMRQGRKVALTGF